MNIDHESTTFYYSKKCLTHAQEIQLADIGRQAGRQVLGGKGTAAAAAAAAVAAGKAVTKKDYSA